MSSTSANKAADWVDRHHRDSTPLINMTNNHPAGEIQRARSPIAKISEMDELDTEGQVSNKPYPGIDDGFFTPGENHGPGVDVPPRGTSNAGDLDPKLHPDDPDGRYAPRHHPSHTPFPYAPGYGPGEWESGFHPDLESIPDVNQYQHKKTLAQGMMDLALFSANANQLRYVLESFERHPYYWPSVVLISFSILLQIAIGMGLILNARYNVKDKKEICIANRINNYTVVGIFLVTAVNVFVSAFGVANMQVTATTTTTVIAAQPPPSPP